MRLLVLLSMLIGSIAAADSNPLITKTNGAGFSPPDWIRYESCMVYDDHVVILKGYGSGENGFEVKEERKITLSGGIEKALKNALNEKIEEKENGLCDAPATTIKFGGEILFATGGCGSPRKDRKGPFSTALKDVVNAYCPKTYDYAGNR